MSANADKALRDTMRHAIEEVAARVGISSSCVAIRFSRSDGGFGWDVAITIIVKKAKRAGEAPLTRTISGYDEDSLKVAADEAVERYLRYRDGETPAEKQERTRAEIRELLKDSPEELARVEAKFAADDQERSRRVREKKS